jgi:hypothetical protein
MERRVGMKVCFAIPDARLRLRMWRSLLPPGLELAPDVDLAGLAERYHLSGGLIKNCILLAATLACRDGRSEIVLTRGHLERAADLQTPTPPDEGRVCQQYAPEATLDGLDLRSRDRQQLAGAARAWGRLRGDGLGLNVLISASDVSTGVGAAEALARECGLEVRQFDYAAVLSSSEADWIFDPVTQRKVRPLSYAFGETLGASALTLFVDHAGEFEDLLVKESRRLYLAELATSLRAHAGLFCMVTSSLGAQRLPAEFHLHFALEDPPEDVQLRRWRERLGVGAVDEADLTALVERWPMHVAEIDHVARQAQVLSAIRGNAQGPGLNEVREVIDRTRSSKATPVLFGGQEESSPSTGRSPFGKEDEGV